VTEISSTVQVVLRDAGYETWIVDSQDTTSLGFEDQVLMGFVTIFPTAESLLASWRERENALLARHAINLRSAGDKAWNVYMAFLTSMAPNEDQVSSIRWIEENLDRTRKLAASDVRTREDVETALLPLLPILTTPQLSSETTTQRLTRRLRVIAPAVAEQVLDEEVSPNDIAALLSERS
jgi:hypothetical protein